jgi:uncharacterized protein
MILFFRSLVVTAVLALFCGSMALAQTEGQTSDLKVITDKGSYVFDVELALTPEERATGLMFREKMDIRHGMLFRFDSVRPVTMWMKNTLIPLDMVFIRADGTVARVHRNAQPHSEKLISSGEPVGYVLELNAGVADGVGIKPGDRIVHQIIR